MVNSIVVSRSTIGSNGVIGSLRSSHALTKWRGVLAVVCVVATGSAVLVRHDCEVIIVVAELETHAGGVDLAVEEE